MVYLLVLLVIASAIFVFADGLNRGMNPFLVVFMALGTLALWILFFPLYFAVRPAKKPKFIYVMNGGYAVPVPVIDPSIPPPPTPQPVGKMWLDHVFDFIAKYKAEAAIITFFAIIIYVILARR